MNANKSCDSAVVVIDFLEKWTCKLAEEVQSIHFGASKQQMTLHTGVIYVAGNPLSFRSFSPCLRHNLAAHMEPVVNLIHTQFPEVKRIDVRSDGPTTHGTRRVFLL